jgi:hypothetical protein
MCGDSTIARKVRLPRELYGRLQWAADTYQVEGGVSGIVRRALRWHANRLTAERCVAVRAYTEPARRDSSTVLTVFLDASQVRWLDQAEAALVRGVIVAYLDLPRPPPPQLYLDPAETGSGYLVVALEAQA